LTPVEQLASGTLSPVLVLDVFLKLGIVLLLLLISLRLLRRYSQQASVLPGSGLQSRLGQFLEHILSPSPQLEQPIRTLSVHPLSRNVTLYLVEVESRKLLLAVSPTEVRPLGEWPADIDLTQPRPGAPEAVHVEETP
jgi:flagellar biogenesis protein FliO